MRLINTRNYRLKDFSGEEHPEYAILSHRWRAGEEMTFQEFMSPNRSTHAGRSGYTKIVRACVKARLKGLEWLWVDTCCIIQNDNEDVARNIESMYSFYKNARLCIVYLHDVWQRGPWSRAGAPFEKSDWFKRGWTLQELLAPRPGDVLFFNAQWQRLGTRSTLAGAIHRVTGIPSSVLDGSASLFDTPRLDRMAWVWNRKTTEPSDLAYCLLGILDVTMEVHPGDDRTRAFQRLADAVAVQFPEPSIEELKDVKDIRVRLSQLGSKALLWTSSAHATNTTSSAPDPESDSMKFLPSSSTPGPLSSPSENEHSCNSECIQPLGQQKEPWLCESLSLWTFQKE